MLLFDVDLAVFYFFSSEIPGKAAETKTEQGGGGDPEAAGKTEGD